MKPTCARCRHKLPHAEFSYSTRTKRYDSYCRACRSAYTRTRRKREARPAPETCVRTTLRLDPALHAWLLDRAALENVALYVLISRVLSRYRSARMLTEQRESSVRENDNEERTEH